MLRTHNCGALRIPDEGKEVCLTGWANRRRNHGGVIFIDLRDRWGITQLVIGSTNEAVYDTANAVKSEYVLQVKGIVRARPEGLINPKIPTGEIELQVLSLTILSEAKLLPFEIEEKNETDEGLRLRYRYLDLRRKRMQNNLILRHQSAQFIRGFLASRDFIEVETPFLTSSTPEGARDFLVPSRLSPGNFYALPQSPQLFKQILMISGFDRYFQIVRCFRDEDLRADRQPEFTQVDIEMSFVEREDILSLMEELMITLFHEILGVELNSPFPRLSYDEAMNRYGCDKPDLRIPFTIDDFSQLRERNETAPWHDLKDVHSAVKGLFFPEWPTFSRKRVDALIQQAKENGVGLSWLKSTGGEISSPLRNKMSDDSWNSLIGRYLFSEHSILLVAWGEKGNLLRFLGEIRTALGKELSSVGPGHCFCWVLDFPLFEWNTDENRWDSMHHPFTAPMNDTLPFLEKEPGKIKAKAYDLVLNGYEVGGGSIRIHRSDVQERIFRLLHLSEEDIRQKFGYFIDALQFGCPPHGGIALGFDRLAMLMSGEESIREVIAFPKTQKGTCLLSDAPSSVTDEQMKILGISLRKTDQR